MNISELIATLEDIRKANGDLEVNIFDDVSGMSGKVDSVDVSLGVVDINATMKYSE